MHQSSDHIEMKMLSFNIKLFLFSSKYLKTINRSIFQYNIHFQKALQINKYVNKYVPLATTPVKQLEKIGPFMLNRNYCTPTVDNITFEKVCEETLESLCEYFEELVETSPHLKSADVSYSGGVLTVNFGNSYGTYVINRQSPNQQIWLSSPVSGPKRYDFIPGSNHWVYKHDNVTLHQLLQNEIRNIVKKDIDFSKCSYSLL